MYALRKITFLLLCLPGVLCGQYAINGAAPFGTGTKGVAGDIPFSPSVGETLIFTTTPPNAGQKGYSLVTLDASGNRVLVNPTDCSQNSSVSSLDNTLITGRTDCGANANFRTNGSTSTYVFKTPRANQSTSFVFWRLTGALRGVSNVTPSVADGGTTPPLSVQVTATLGEGLPTPNGQNMYIRYSTDGFATSAFVRMTDNLDGTWTGSIPAQTTGATVEYYVLSSADSEGDVNVVALDDGNADLRTIALDNNGGANYSFTVEGTLPITLMRFAARRNGGSVLAEWETRGESAAGYFALDRSADGGKNWSEVDRVRAANRPEGARYRILDAVAPASDLLYRLRQYDLDGTLTTGPTAFVASAGRATALYAYPLPASASAVRIRGEGLTGRSARLVNPAGQTVLTLPLTGGEQGLPACRLKAGVYFLQVAGLPEVTRRIVVR